MGHRLLIVDDEEAIVLTMKEYFETFGHQVDVADLRLHPLRDSDGLDLLALVRERFPATRVVLFTGYATPEVVSEARRLGVDAFLQKPQALTDVARVVFGLLTSRT
jgi:CheY-like chemotaxis protein